MTLRNISMIPTLSAKYPPIEDITDDLPKKHTWSALPNKRYIHHGVDTGEIHLGLRQPEDITTIVIHHSGPPEGSIKSHANYHMKQWGAGIAYHLVIDEGRIWQTNDLLDFTFHVGGHNTYTVGICVNRDLTRGDLSSQERELLYAAILTVKYHIPTVEHILGHNELNKTACPCTSMNRIREDVKALEEQIHYEHSDNNTRASAYAIAERILDLYKKAQNSESPYSDEAVRKLLLLEPVMKENHII
jgi:hypothetical protein